MGDNGGSSKHPYQEFKINAADEKGHVERLQVRVPPQMFSKIQKAVNSHKWPYENYQEFVRHAILKQLNWLEADDPTVGNLTAQISAINANLKEEEQQQQMEATYEKMRTVFRKNLSIGGTAAHSRNLKLVADLWQNILKIDDTYWRNIWMQKFRKEYDAVLDAVPNVSLGDLADDGDVGE